MASCPPRKPTNSNSYLRIDNRSTYAIVTLNREPVNTMNLAMWEQLSQTLDKLEANPEIRGVIFQSGLQRDVFTAGNDILELYAPNTSKERYREFWMVSNTFLSRLYTSRLVTVAAIRGACPAGGCCLALCCDYRIITETGTMGLNEVALGISVPKFWGHLMQRAIGVGPADKLLQFAVMVASDEARELGLVEDVVPKQKLQLAAESAMLELLKVPDAGRIITKLLLRGDFAKEWRSYLEYEANEAWHQLSSPETVAKLKAVMDKLSGKKQSNMNDNDKNKKSTNTLSTKSKL